MKLQKRILALAVASALVAPNALAVQGSDGMHYTSASEGLYASIRAQFRSSNKDGDNPVIKEAGTRWGIQGSGEMSHGLEAFYRYEGALGNDNGANVSTRMAHVGLRGNFGDMAVGTVWSNEYNWVYGATDLPNAGGGNWVTYGGGISDSSRIAGFRGRTSTSLQYTSPDFNGLQVSGRFDVNGGNDKKTTYTCANGDLYESGDNRICLTESGGGSAPTEATADSHNGDLDQWALSAKYGFQGFTVAGTYTQTPDWGMKQGGADASSRDDLTAWALRGGYSQDNWSLNVWYGENSTSDFDAFEKDSTAFSVAGTVDIGQTTVVVLHEVLEADAGDDAVSVFDIQYKLNSKAKVWAGYVARDFDSDATTDDYFNVGLRHDF